MGGCFFGLAVIFFIIGVVQLLAPDRSAPAAPAGERLWPFAQPANARPAAPQPAAVPPSQFSGGTPMQAAPQKLNWIQMGQRIFVKHPVRGELMAHVLGRLVFTELWQRSRGPQAPWVPTGSAFLGFWLEGGLLLLNWQNRFYLLDERLELSDADIQRDFAAHARTFAQSDQKAEVLFAWPPAMWRMVDIGKFQIESIEGQGPPVRQGLVGRFIHASGDSSRALVVEDYEGGGQDAAWTGYTITEEDIRKESA